MGVQFNLLPDVKLEYNRAQRAKRLVYSVSILAGGVVLVITILSFLIVNVLQKKVLDSANNDITTYTQKLKKIPDLDKVLTIQNQLGSLPGMHQKKHITSRLFAYLPQILPDKAFIGKLDLDTSAQTITITGTADTVETVNQFVDTLKFTTYSSSTSDGKNASNLAFSNVVLTKVDRNDNAGSNSNALPTSYIIDAKFDPILFDATKTVALVVPNEITTRSVINSPGATGSAAQSQNELFNGDTGQKQDSSSSSNSGSSNNGQ